MAETRFRAECDVIGPNATGFIVGDLLKVDPAWIVGLGKPLAFASVGLEVEAAPTSDSLLNPKRELKLEVLREDPKRLYIEFMSQWPQLPMGAALDLTQVRPIDKNPSAYMDEAWGYLTKRLQGLVSRGDAV